MSQPSSPNMKNAYLGVDVGSGSVRAVALNETGTCLASAVESLQINHPLPDYYEQSTQQIWNATCQAVRRVVGVVLQQGLTIKGIGFDATCSMVMLDEQGSPLSVSPAQSKPLSLIWDVMMWMDHRAVDQADRINATKHPRLKHVGQQISVEMEPPKLLWLKENKPEVWRALGHAMDLVDFLTYKASGSLIRSQCTVVCKLLYAASPAGGKWDSDFWSCIGLQELVDSPKIGTDVRSPGAPCGFLTPAVLASFGLPPDSRVAVGVGIIDAHAGVLGLLGASTREHPHLEKLDVVEKMCIISGTSACHMTMSKTPRFVNGVWGPNYGVIFDGYWSNEAGQSALGPILDQIAASRPSAKEAKDKAGWLALEHGRIQFELQEYERANGALATASLTSQFHVWPDYRGNRSPLADHNCRGVIAGLRLKSDITDESLSVNVSYLAHVQALAYMTRFIMETTAEYSGDQAKPVSVIYLCGGLQKNPIYVQTHADVCQVPVVVPADSEVVARGAAILGACASGATGTLVSAIRALSCKGSVVTPRKETFAYHQNKYKAFRLLGNTEREIRRIMTQ